MCLAPHAGDTSVVVGGVKGIQETGLVMGHCQGGSLTGAVASQKVTEALKGSRSTVGNRT
ncbi:hypothetical protein BGU94_18725 [Clostridioides difficile]|nr:hypothetical protein BGU94_18725 [Clostridioides difficile]